MRRWILPIILVAACALLPGQTLVEAGTAAAGGSLAGVAGKKVSDGFDAVMKGVTDTAKKASLVGEDPKKPRKLAPPVPPIPTVKVVPGAGGGAAVAGAAATPAAGRYGSRVAGTGATEIPAVAEAAAEPVVPAPPPNPEPVVTAADVESTTIGASREEVLGRLGKPSARISMGGEEGFVEIYTFRSQGERIGSVRLVNGKVAEVKPIP